MRQPRVARTLLLLACALIIYASVYPVHLRAVPGPLIVVLLATWQDRLRFLFPGDIVANVILYVPLGFLAFFSVSARHRDALRIGGAAAFGFALSVAMETIQLYESDRISSYIDVIANTAGALFAAGIAAKLNRHPGLLARPAPLILFGSWIGATGLLMSDRNMHLTTMTAVPWVIGVFAAIVLFAELLGRPAPVGPAAALLIAGLVWRELEPFTFSAGRQDFHWVPFATSFAASRGSGIAVFIDKVFYYGATVWFCGGLVRSLAASTLLITAMLAALEAVQMYIPGRIAESSDPVLSLILGFVLYMLHSPAAKKFDRL